MVSEERLEQLERSLHLAGNALQAANNRIASLESTAAASMVDMRVLGKPSIFAGDEASWKGWSFVMLSFSAAVSPELRALMQKARINVDGMLNVHLTSAEQVWSRQLYYMLSLSTSGEAQRRLQNVPEGEGAEAWKVFSEHYEPKTATRYVGMLRQILLYDFGELTQLIDRIEQFRHLVRKYEEQSGESVTEQCAAGCVPGRYQRCCESEITWLFMRVGSTPSIRWLLRCQPLPGLAVRMMLCQWMSL